MIKYLEESTILNYMKLVIDVRRTFEQGYDSGWRTPQYNYFVTKYRIICENQTIILQWHDLNDRLQYMIFRNSPYRSKLLTKIYFFIHSKVDVTDRAHFSHVLKSVVFPDFCKELELTDTDFADVSDYTNAADRVLVSIYKNFFTSISLDKFISMFNLEKLLTKKSLIYVKEHCVS